MYHTSLTRLEVRLEVWKLGKKYVCIICLSKEDQHKQGIIRPVLIAYSGAAMETATTSA